MPFYPDLKKILKQTSIYGEPQKKLNQVASNLINLKKGLSELPQKSREDKLLIATFNIRDFDTNRNGYGFRQLESMYYLAEIISAFDIVAIQEIGEDTKPLKRLIKILGSNNYGCHIGSTQNAKGEHVENMAFIYDLKKVQLKGEPKTIELSPVVDFSRKPFLTTFQAGWCKFNLCTTHIYFGSNSGTRYNNRLEEIQQLAEYFQVKSEQEAENFILLGDFNVISRESACMKALTSGGFKIPDALQSLKGTNLTQDKHYDQIVFKEGETGIKFSGNAGVFNFFEHVYTEDSWENYIEDMIYTMETTERLYAHDFNPKIFNTWRTHQMSDHLPLWVELDINYSQDYLQNLIQPICKEESTLA